ncbi:DUF1127 domain-containing protein [Ruegeria arenilitoris]|uniref:DUF1127 domain-containing protein n=1 Tax=Ruegeria arenilitoris TaxID=1173585 RepID=UPI00147B0711|nr:DUF1127 domain-containing protein [Ruegeria arenilitoris]
MTQIAISHSGSTKRVAKRKIFWNLLNLARQRRSLARLDDHLLDDIGLTRREATRHIWDAPDNWVKQLY